MGSYTARHIIQTAIKMGASDIHLTVYQPPVFRVNGDLITRAEDKRLTVEDTRRLGTELLPRREMIEDLMQEGELDFSSAFSGLGRVRVNLFLQRGSCAAAIRIIPMYIPQLSTLGLPDTIAELAMMETGLILVSGIAGSGKSTTLASMVDHMNRNRRLNILTLEDPIEYLHQHQCSIVNQREVGSDTSSFSSGLRAALRQDPDVILVGEMRDLDTIATTITAAETGHLVLATLHSATVVQAVERVVDVFPDYQQEQIRIQLATCLQGIICQQLIPRIDRPGRVVAVELLRATPAVRSLIRENKTHQLYSAMQTGSAEGMCTMDNSLQDLYQQDLISLQELRRRMIHPLDPAGQMHTQR
jgi:twitching motility protein PilT